MNRIAALAAVAALAGTASFAPNASASNVAWGVSIGAPGVAVSVGQPAYWGAYGYRYPYGHYRHWHRPVIVAPPVVYPAPVYYPRPVYVAPRPVYVAPPTYGYGYGYRY